MFVAYCLRRKERQVSGHTQQVNARDSQAMPADYVSNKLMAAVVRARQNGTLLGKNCSCCRSSLSQKVSCSLSPSFSVPDHACGLILKMTMLSFECLVKKHSQQLFAPQFTETARHSESSEANEGHFCCCVLTLSCLPELALRTAATCPCLLGHVFGRQLAHCSHNRPGILDPVAHILSVMSTLICCWSICQW